MSPAPIDLRPASASDGLAADARALDALRRAATADPGKAIKQVATQFEALFMQMVLKSMRAATPQSGILDSNQQQMYTDMLDQQLAQKIAVGGTGLAAVIERQLGRNLPAVAVAAGSAATSPPAAVAKVGSAREAAAYAGGPVIGKAMPPDLLGTLQSAAIFPDSQNSPGSRDFSAASARSSPARNDR